MSASDIPSERLRRFLARHRQAHVAYWLEADPISGIYVTWSLFRADSKRPFHESDRLFVEAVGPLLVDAWNQSWLRQLEAVSPPSQPVGYSQAVVTSSGVLTVTDDRVAASIQLEWPDWQGPLLPGELLEQFQRRRLLPYRGRKVVARFQELPDHLARVQLREQHALDSLPARKQAVARLFAAGQSQAAIGRRLSLASSTVNNYLVDIYRQLDVSDKAQLATRVSGLPE